MRNVYDVLVRVMTAAVDDKVIASSPCRRITLPAMPDEEVTPPTVEHVEAMARVMPQYIRAAVVTLAGSGLRIGELLGLKVPDIDFKAGTIRVERQRLQSGKIGPPKTTKSGARSRSARLSPTHSSHTSRTPLKGVAVHDG